MKKLKLILQYNWLFIILSLLLFLYVFIRTQVIKYESKYSLAENQLTGIITNYSLNGNVLKLDILGKEKVKVNYYLQSEEEKEHILNNIYLGSKIVMTGEFKIPVNNTIPNTFNYKKYLYYNKIFYTFTANNYKIIKKGNFPFTIKDNILKKIYKMDHKDYLLVFILGDKTLLTKEDYQNYQINGTAHLLAISGMHIGLIIKFLKLFLNKIKDYGQFLIIISVLLFFAFLTGFSASVNRVILFWSLNYFNQKLDYPLNNLQVLFITVFLLLIFNPFYIYDYGFLYSSIITGGLLYYQDKIKGNYLQKILKISIIAFLFSLPITVNLNYEINLLSILSNLIFVPIISFIIYPFSLISIIIPNPLWNIGIDILINLNNIIRNFGLLINIPKLSLGLIISYYIFLILGKSYKLKIFLIVIIGIAKLEPKLINYSQAYFLDVGQGDSALFISPYQKEVIMVDTGGKINYNQELWQQQSKTYNISDNIIKFLKSLGIKKINYLILTHGDYDHMGESLNIVNNLLVEKVILNEGAYNNLEKNLIKVLEKKKIPYYKGLKELNLGVNKLFFLNGGSYDNENDNSNVIYTEISKYKFLLMGDASTQVERAILEKYNLNNITVLKVGHHGSKTSSSRNFIMAIKPQYAIISVGKNNRYSHPNKDVLLNLQESKIFRTDQEGSISFYLKKDQLEIKTYPP